MRDIRQCIPTYWYTSADQLAKTQGHQLYTDTGCCLQDSLRAINNKTDWERKSRDTKLLVGHDDDDDDGVNVYDDLKYFWDIIIKSSLTNVKIDTN